jgi:DHA1 family inner membrane transport protein
MSPSQPARPHEAPPYGVGVAHFAMAIGSFALGTAEFTPMGLLPDVARGIGVSIPMAGHMISAYAMGAVVGGPIIAAGFARAPRRAMLIGLMLIFALASFTSAAAAGYGSLIVSRFVAGLPHGAYFGIAMLVAAQLGPQHKRAQSVGRMLLGLSVANVIGAPFATFVGETFGWRSAFIVIGALGILTASAVRLCVRPMAALEGASPMRELGALRRPQVWLTLGIAAIGFGGIFAVYSYVTPMLINITGIRETTVPIMLAIVGMGMICGSLVGGWLADKGLMRAIAIVLVFQMVVLSLFVITAPHFIAMAVNMFLLGVAALSLGPALQTRLMDVAADAQTLAASLNHSAFNLANALGAWIGGVAIAAGLGWTSTGPIGTVLAAGGFVVFIISWLFDRRTTARESASARHTA